MSRPLETLHKCTNGHTESVLHIFRPFSLTGNLNSRPPLRRCDERSNIKSKYKISTSIWIHGSICLNRKLKFEAALAQMRWKIKWSDVVPDIQQFRAGSMSRISIMSVAHSKGSRSRRVSVVNVVEILRLMKIIKILLKLGCI